MVTGDNLTSAYHHNRYMAGLIVTALPGLVEINPTAPGQPALLSLEEVDRLLTELIAARLRAFPGVGRLDFIDPKEVM